MTKIEWTDEIWNPIAGCSIKSSGCDNCYAMRMAHRLEAIGLDKYQGTTRKDNQGRLLWTGKVNFDEKALLKPLLWKKPRKIFVNSMSDLFHNNVPDDWIDKIFAVMALCPQHTFQVLTKRPERMREYLRGGEFKILDEASLATPSEKERLEGPVARKRIAWKTQKMLDVKDWDRCNIPWPLKNVWLGVSVEDQKTANERIPHLLSTPAAVRWISAEPLLGPVDLENLNYNNFLTKYMRDEEAKKRLMSPLAGTARYDVLHGHMKGPDDMGLNRLDWVVVGGESGPNARPMHPDWVRTLRNQCKNAGVPFFFKQWGEFVSASEVAGPGRHHIFPDGATVRRTGKQTAGHTLDGDVIQQYPAK